MLSVAAVSQATGLPTFSELERAGARIGEIRVVSRNIFDTNDPDEDKALFRLANALHRVTRPEVIRRALLFSSGEPVSVRVIEETERLLRSNRYLYDVQIRPMAVNAGVVDVEVATRDTWSIDAGISFGRAGGTNRAALRLLDYNLLGTGVTLGVTRSDSLDRMATDYVLKADRLFGSRFVLDVAQSDASDGRSRRASLIRPFYENDARWSAGLAVSEEERVDTLRHAQRRAEVFVGWSKGLVDGWVQRYSAGVLRTQDRYEAQPNPNIPPVLPPDRDRTVPFFRHEILEDRFASEVNRSLMGRPEFFALGLRARIQLGRATAPEAGGARPWLYELSVGQGFVPDEQDLLMTQARLTGESVGGDWVRQRQGASAQYYRPQGPSRLLFASVSLEQFRRPDPDERLTLGGDDGLRGFPLRYQSGTKRVLFTLEQRFFSDLYPWRLFRIGGAAFLDIGRAWGAPEATGAPRPWLRNVGLGLRLFSVRSALGNVLHVDVAAPVKAPPGISRLQLLIATKKSF